MSFYDRLATTAEKLIAQYGSSLTLHDPGAGTYDPVTGVTTGAAATDTTTHGVALMVTSELRAAMDIKGGDRVYLLDATVEPKLSQQLVLDGAPWQIGYVMPLKPGDTVLAYIVQLMSGSGGVRIRALGKV